MNKAWTLMKIMVKMQLSMVGKSDSEKFGLGCSILLILPFAGLLLYSFNGLIEVLYNTLSPTGNENVILGLIFTMMFIVFFFVSISTVLSSFYFAEDVEPFIALPFQPYQVLLGKSAIPFLSLYGINTALLLPVLMFYGEHSQAEILYYIYALILWVLAPLIPFVFASIFIIFIMRFANISKNKDRTKILMGTMGFLFIIGFNIVIRLNSGNSSEEGIAPLIQEQNTLLELVTKFFPTAYFSSVSLTNPSSLPGILYLLLVLGLSIVFLFLFMTVGQSMYFKGVLGLSGGSRKNFSEKAVTKNMKKRSILTTLMVKETRIILRTPTFFTQIIMQSLFVPVFLIVIVLLETNGSFSSIGTLLNGWGEKKSLLILFGVTIITLGVNPASISAISRDGKSWFNHLYLPIQANTVMRSKILISFSISLLSLTIISILTLFVLNIGLITWFCWLILSLLTNWITSNAGVLVDLSQPKLNWTDEREVFKGRFIGLIALAIIALVFGLAILILWNVAALQGTWLVFFILLFYLCLLTFICHQYLKRMIKEKYFNLL